MVAGFLLGPLAGVAFAANSVTPTAGTTPQSTAVGSAFVVALQVTVTNGSAAVPNDPVTFVANAGPNGASGTFASSTPVLTDAAGIATATTMTANPIAGPFAVTATEPTGGIATFSLTNTAGPPASVTITAGDNQSATVNTALATLQVQVRDGSANPVANDPVTFVAVPGTKGSSGTFANSIPVATDAFGIATASALTANTKAGTWKVRATEGGVGHLASFTLTNAAGPPASVTVSAGSGQSAKVLTPFGAALVVVVRDRFANPASGTAVSFSAPTSGATGSFAGGANTETATTDAAGAATASSFTAGSAAGTYSVAVSAGAASALFTLTNVAVAPGSPQFVAAGTSGNLVTVVWSPPAFDGGLPVTSYTVTLLSGGQIKGITTTSLQFISLSNGACLSITVTAVNAVGSGVASAPVKGCPTLNGYWLVGTDGGIFTFGAAGYYGSTGALHLNKPIVSMALTPTGRGYWLAASDGGIFTFGDAPFLGSTGAMNLNQPIVGMAATPSGRGYWLVASDGGIFTFGDAAFLGSTGAMNLNQPIVGMAATPSGRGYWLVASDGGIFTFGDAAFRGSTGGMHLNRPVVGMSPTITGGGYWLVASDGGIFTFGDAVFRGSTGATRINKPIIGMAESATGNGYWLVASDGGIFTFGDAVFYGSEGSTALSRPIIGIGYQPRTRIS